MKTNKDSEKKRSYASALRDKQAEETRALILKAVGEKLAATGPSGLSVLEIAKAAGVTARTVYRHFGSREQLLVDLQKWISLRTMPAMPRDIEALPAFSEQLFEAFDQHEVWIEALLQTGNGAALREAGKKDRVAAIRALVDGALPGIPERIRAQAAAITKFLLSAEAWRALRNDSQLTGRASGKAVRWALEALLAALKDKYRKGEHMTEIRMDPQDVVGYAYALVAANSTGLLKAVIENGGATAEAYAWMVGTDVRATARVLELLAASGLLRREKDEFRASERLERLAKDMPGGLDFATLLYGHTETFLRTGRPLIEMDGDLAARADNYSRSVGGLAKAFAEAAAQVADVIQLEENSSLLDVGCGSGIWSLEIARRHPGAIVTGQDLPAVLEVFERQAQEMGLEGRTRKLAGDMHTVCLPDGAFSLVIVANVLRLEPADKARALLARAVKAVKPGGQILIVDALAGGSQLRELASAAYALHLSLRTRTGEVHSPATLIGWLEAEGITQVRTLQLINQPGALGALLGVRRSSTLA